MVIEPHHRIANWIAFRINGATAELLKFFDSELRNDRFFIRLDCELKMRGCDLRSGNVNVDAGSAIGQLHGEASILAGFHERTSDELVSRARLHCRIWTFVFRSARYVALIIEQRQISDKFALKGASLAN